MLQNMLMVQLSVQNADIASGGDVHIKHQSNFEYKQYVDWWVSVQENFFAKILHTYTRTFVTFSGIDGYADFKCWANLH